MKTEAKEGQAWESLLAALAKIDTAVPVSELVEEVKARQVLSQQKSTFEKLQAACSSLRQDHLMLQANPEDESLDGNSLSGLTQIATAWKQWRGCAKNDTPEDAQLKEWGELFSAIVDLTLHQLARSVRDGATDTDKKLDYELLLSSTKDLVEVCLFMPEQGPFEERKVVPRSSSDRHCLISDCAPALRKKQKKTLGSDHDSFFYAEGVPSPIATHPVLQVIGEQDFQRQVDYIGALAKWRSSILGVYTHPEAKWGSQVAALKQAACSEALWPLVDKD